MGSDALALQLPLRVGIVVRQQNSRVVRKLHPQPLFEPTSQVPYVSTQALFLLLAGAAVLVVGAEGLVMGASRLAARLGLSPLVIGLTVVAAGTSAPELTVSLIASLSGQPEIALGNVVGSNVFNVLFILGLSAAITPLVVHQQLIRLDVPLLITVSVLVLVLALDGRFGRVDGLLLVGGSVAYTALLLRMASRELPKLDAVDDPGPERRFGAPSRALLDVALVLGGLGLLVLGSRWMVRGAVQMAQALGVSETIIGLTIIAAGTSLPEVATSVMASIRGQRDIAVGNVLGSCLFNLLAILGLASAVASGGIPVGPSMIGFDLPIMIVVSLACLPILFTGHRIDRWEGWLFLGYYLAYTAYLIMDSAGHDALPLFSAVMGVFVIPLTIVTLSVVLLRAMRARPAQPDSQGVA